MAGHNSITAALTNFLSANEHIRYDFSRPPGQTKPRNLYLQVTIWVDAGVIAFLVFDNLVPFSVCMELAIPFGGWTDWSKQFGLTVYLILRGVSSV